MKFTSRLWFVGAWWLVPSMVALGVWYVSSTHERDGGYALSSAANAAQSTALTYGLAGAAGALASARLAAAGWLDAPIARSRYIMLTQLVWTIVLAAGSAVAITFAWGMARDGALAWPGWQIPLSSLALLVAAVSVGVLLGRYLRPWLASATSLTLAYVVLGFPPALEPLWLRHLVGVSGSCCLIDQTVAPNVVFATTGLALAVSVAAMLLATPGPARYGGPPLAPRLTSAVAAVSVAAGVAVGAVSDFGPDPVIPRSGNPECVSPNSVPTICVWPEHRAAVRDYTPMLAAVARIEARAGLTPTRTFSEQPARQFDQIALYLRSRSDERTRLDDVVNALAPGLDKCLDRNGDTVGTSGGSDLEGLILLREWWAEQLALELHGASDNKRVTKTALAHLSSTEQSKWLNETTYARKACLPSPPPGEST